MKKPCNNCPMRLDQTTPEWQQCQLDRILTTEGQSFSQMACHKSKEGEEFACIGWVISQLNNDVENIGLRISIVTGKVNPRDYNLSFPVHNSISEAFQNKILKPDTLGE